MGFLDFLLGAAIAMNVLDTHDPKQPEDGTPQPTMTMRRSTMTGTMTITSATGWTARMTMLATGWMAMTMITTMTQDGEK